jgi:CubicO group peptidase (beta-lactamase class C family)
MTIRSRLRSVALAASALLAACSSTPPRPGTVAGGDYTAVRGHLEALIAHDMRAEQVTGMSIALVDDQHVVWAFGAGWADQQAGQAATEHTVYRMGSISKLLTATAALQLVRSSRLSLDAPIQRALPGFRIRSRAGDGPITARQLMTHHAGLPRDVSANMWGSRLPSLQSSVAALQTQDAAYPPGQHFDYSNIGASVLGAAIEQLAGEPFEAWMRTTLIEPLGMHSASFSSELPTSALTAQAYDQGKPAVEPALRDVPAGGLNASVLDLAQYVKMIFAQGRIGDTTLLAPGQVQEMLRPQNADVPLDLNFRVGLGWMLSTLGGETVEGGGPVAHHAGATVNFRSQVFLLPEHKLGVIVASNSASAGPVVNRVAQRALALALQAKTGIRQPETAPPQAPSPAPWPPQALHALVGDYTTLAGFVQVRLDGVQLQADLAGRQLQLLPQADGTLRLRYKLLGLLPVSLGDLDRLRLQLRRVAGRQVLVARIGEQEMLAGERLPPATPIDPQLLANLQGTYQPDLYPGEYPSVERVVVRQVGNRLLAYTQLKGQPLGPTGEVVQPVNGDAFDAFEVLGPLAHGGAVARLERSEPGVFTYSGYRFRRVAP